MISDSSFTTKKPKPRLQKPDNFVEALRGTGSPRKDPSIEYKRRLRESENKILADRLRMERHKEVIETQVFSRAEEEIKAEIVKIQQELKKLAKELAQMDQGAQKAAEEELVNPGTYHLAFFEKLRSFLLQLRKKVAESENWLAISSQRKRRQNYYWKGVNKSGTKFMLSQERYMSTQAG
jgi:hypothetical protein